MKTRKLNNGTHAIPVLTLLLLLGAVHVSGCVTRPDFAFPLKNPTIHTLLGKAVRPLAKANIPELPYSMTWSVDANDKDITFEWDRTMAAFPFWSAAFWNLVESGSPIGASGFFSKPAQVRFALLAPDNKTICEKDWLIVNDDLNEVTCELSKIQAYYGKGLTAVLDYRYAVLTEEDLKKMQLKQDEEPHYSFARTFYVVVQ